MLNDMPGTATDDEISGFVNQVGFQAWKVRRAMGKQLPECDAGTFEEACDIHANSALNSIEEYSAQVKAYKLIINKIMVATSILEIEEILKQITNSNVGIDEKTENFAINKMMELWQKENSKNQQ